MFKEDAWQKDKTNNKTKTEFEMLKTMKLGNKY